MGTVITIIIGAILLLALYMWNEAYRNRIRIHRLHFPQLPKSFDGYRLFFISDVHRRLIPLSMIDQLRGKTQLIIIGGDLCEKGVSIGRIEENIKRLTSIAPCMFVWGNNDQEVGRDKLSQLLQKHQVEELTNKVKMIERMDHKIIIAGVDDAGHQRDDLAKVIRASEDHFAILVSHYPNVARDLPATHPFSLVLSGHTHGGQIRLFGWGLASKGRLIRLSNYIHLISNGFGTTGIPMRLGAPAETHLIVLSLK